MKQHSHLDLLALARKHNKSFAAPASEGNSAFVYIADGKGRTIWEGDPEYQKAYEKLKGNNYDNEAIRNCN